MPIYRDPSEPELDGVLSCARLEEWTGADYLVTPSRLPCSTHTLILSHIQKSQAVLVQVKRGADLFASLGQRVLSSLARMCATGARKHQCLLVTSGLYLPDAQGEAYVGHLRYAQDHRPYTVAQPAPVSVRMKGIYTELRRWGLRGGSYVPLAREGDFLPFLQDLERDLCTLPPEREVWPPQPEIQMVDPDDPLQELRLVRDKGLIMLAALIGPVKAQAAVRAWGDVATALMWLSAPEVYASQPDMYPEGIGPKTCVAVRNALGGSILKEATVEEKEKSQ